MNVFCSSRHFKIALLLLSIAAISVLPGLINGVFNGHDSRLHLLWSNFFSQQLLSGDLYPRWLTDMNNGLGSPVFHFYPPLPYYIYSLLSVFADSSQFGNTLLCISLLLSLVIGSFGMYLWSLKYVSERAAVIAAIVYMILPYHLLINVYLRVAVAESWAMAIFPYIFYSMTLIKYAKYKFFLGVSVSMTLLLITHPPSAVISLPFIALYALTVLIEMKPNKGQFFSSALIITITMLVAFLLAAFYLIPAIFFHPEHLDALWEKSTLYHSNFLFDAHRHYWFGYVIEASLLVNLLLAIAYWAVLIAEHGRRKPNEMTSFIAVAIALSFMMTTPIANFIYSNIELMAKIQFPWRYISINALIAAIASAKIYDALRNSKLGSLHLAHRVTPAVIALAILFTPLVGQFILPRFGGASFFTTEKYQSLFENTRDAPEYQLSDDSLALKNHPLVVQTDDDIHIIKFSADDILLSGNFSPGQVLVLNHYYYANLRYQLDNKPDLLPLARTEKGLMKIIFPADASSVRIRRISLKEERIGLQLSLFGLAIFLPCSFLFFRFDQR